jgi:phospholipase C
MKAGDKFFGELSAGSPFHVYAPGKYKNEDVRTWAYAVAVGDELKDIWALDDFENGNYHLRVYGPNGFFREFRGNKKDPVIDVMMKYEQKNDKPSGNIIFQVINKDKQPQIISIADNSYKTGTKERSIGRNGSRDSILEIALDTGKSFGWYDFSVKIKGNSSYGRRYAGRVETGMAGKTDPLMGRLVKFL